MVCERIQNSGSALFLHGLKNTRNERLIADLNMQQIILIYRRSGRQKDPQEPHPRDEWQFYAIFRVAVSQLQTRVADI